MFGIGYLVGYASCVVENSITIVGSHMGIVVAQSSHDSLHVEVGILQRQQPVVPCESGFSDGVGPIDVRPYDERQFASCKSSQLVLMHIISIDVFGGMWLKHVVDIYGRREYHEIEVLPLFYPLHPGADTCRCEIVVRIHKHPILSLGVVHAEIAASLCPLGCGFSLDDFHPAVCRVMRQICQCLYRRSVVDGQQFPVFEGVGQYAVNHLAHQFLVVEERHDQRHFGQCAFLGFIHGCFTHGVLNFKVG